MRYYATDTFDMPHTTGIKATIERLDEVVFDRNVFGGFDARIYTNDSDDAQPASRVSIAISDTWIRKRLGLGDSMAGMTVADEDVVLWCKRAGEYINWYRVTYGYSN